MNRTNRVHTKLTAKKRDYRSIWLSNAIRSILADAFSVQCCLLLSHCQHVDFQIDYFCLSAGMDAKGNVLPLPLLSKCTAQCKCTNPKLHFLSDVIQSETALKELIWQMNLLGMRVITSWDGADFQLMPCYVNPQRLHSRIVSLDYLPSSETDRFAINLWTWAAYVKTSI